MANSKNVGAAEVVVLDEEQLEAVTGGAGDLAVTSIQQLLTSFNQSNALGTIKVSRLDRGSFLFDVVAN
jgi:hypothetical protein